MLRKLTLGLVAAASLSALALAPSAASAKPWGGGGGWGGGWGGIHHHYFDRGIAFVDAGSCYVTHRILTPYGYRLITENVCD